MSNRELDRIFRERLGNFEMEPPMHLWESIAAARANARRPARPWLWWGGSSAILALTAGVALWFFTGKTGTPASQDSVQVVRALAAGEDAPSSTAAVPAPAEAFSLQGTTAEEELNRPERQAKPPIVAGPDVPDAKPASTAVSSAASLVATAEERDTPPLSAHVKDALQGSTYRSGGDLAPVPALTTASLTPVRRNARPRDGFPENSCRPFSKEQWKLNWYLEAVASPEYVFRNLSARTKDFAAYADERHAMEEVRGGFTAGFRINAVTDFGLSLRSGLQYTQINEVLNYRDPDDMRIIVTNVYDGQGNIIGSDTIFEPGTRVRVSYNRYRMLDVPLMAGYEFQFPRFSMTLHGGALFNLLFVKKGDILGPEGEPVRISTAEANPYPAFNDRLGISLGGAIGFNYRLTPELQFMVEPQFRIVLDPVTRSDYPLKQDYFLTGISLGVRQKL